MCEHDYITNPPLEYLAYGMYDTAGLMAISSAYRCDVLPNALEKLSPKKKLYEDTILCLCGK